MEANEDPYAILGVSHSANEQEIKAAYRKLALKHHPDKQRTEEARETAHVTFAKISNAYELLSDKRKRQEYDTQQQMNFNYPAAAGGFGADEFHDPFGGFGRAGGFGNSGRGGTGMGGNPFFHDPFQVFESVFREEFGGPSFSSSFGNRRGGNMGSFHDDFFAGRGGDPMMNMMRDSFLRGGSLFGGGLFGDSMMGGGPRGGRRGARDPFEDLFAGLSQHQQQHGQAGNGTFYSYSSTTTSSRMNNGESVTEQTTTKLVNGVPQTVTERIVRRADGTVERQVLQNGRAIEEGVEQAPPQMLDYQQQQQQEQLEQPPAQRRSTNEKKKSASSKNKLFKNPLQHHETGNKRKRQPSQSDRT